MKIGKITASNFLSFEKLEFNFEDGVTVISGVNKTEDDQESNGSGKSGLQQIIYHAITGNNLRGVIDKKLIRKGCNSASNSIEIICPQRKQTLLIERELSMKGSGKLNISLLIKKEWEDVSFATVLDGNKFIMEWIGITQEDLKSFFIICKENYKSFFKMSNTEKMALISRFINFSNIDRTKTIIEEEITQINADKRIYQDKIVAAESKIELLEEQIKENNKEDFENSKKEKLSALKEEKEDCENRILIKSNSIDEKKSEMKALSKDKDQEIKLLSALKKELEEIKKADNYDSTFKEIDDEIEQTNDAIKEERKSLAVIKEKKNAISQRLSEISTLLAGTITCPKCKHEFILKSEKSVADLIKERSKKQEDEKSEEKSLEEKSSSILDLEAIKTECFNLRSEIEKESQEIKNQIRKVENKISDQEISISKTERDIKIKANVIESLEREIEKILVPELASIEEREKSVIESKWDKDKESLSGKLIDQIKEIQKSKKASEDKVSEYDEKIYKKLQWQERFKDFKRTLSVEQLKNIENEINIILNNMNSDLRLMLEGYKRDAKGNLKEEITPYILREEPEVFSYYSGGERVRIELSTIMAIQKLINITNPYGGLDFLHVDEITEGLDSKGLFNIVESMSYVKSPIVITTHVLSESINCRQIVVTKENGISKIN